jgi:3-hydroxyisobutyrate dehydrogenase-like beta-hydroxyacid dehydrogenase
MTKPPVIAILAPGEMGAGVGRRLVERGAEVVVCLDRRSEASLARAKAAGMRDVPETGYAQADMILSIVPPGDALAIAQQLAPVLKGAARKPLYVDCNAVSPETVQKVAAVIEATGAPFVDAGIIGNPPRGDGYTPVIYASGTPAARFAEIGAYGLDIRVMDGGPGQASALKMCYAGLTKGLHAVGVSVILGAIEAGVAEPFLKEIAESQPQLLAYFTGRTPGVFAKSYRWVAEMEEIGAFLEGGGQTLYQGAAQQFARLAADHEGPRADEAAIKAFLKGQG